MRQGFELRKGQIANDAKESATQLEVKYNKELDAEKQKHAEETALLRKDVDAFSQAVLHRDKLLAMSDKEMKVKFSDLAQDIETIARGNWKQENTQWTSEIMKSLSTNQRLLGKHIIQNCIWMALNEHLFISPSRVLGAEGRALEEQWWKNCGSSEDRYPYFTSL